ncbi:hypothetical protein GGX14DRAFT_398830 [Mycena pura]|uniref:Uncharacterized protein n=1 Tax=Mycena pura TaxID=153505 RepID=A0AAD6V553_9AGAR|nr:hypothetical protein GGX14DRAFT_398830 [Mycena pura]
MESDIFGLQNGLAPAQIGFFRLGLGFECRSKPKPGRSAYKPVCHKIHLVVNTPPFQEFTGPSFKVFACPPNAKYGKAFVVPTKTKFTFVFVGTTNALPYLAFSGHANTLKDLSKFLKRRSESRCSARQTLVLIF